jgi:c-di-GMP-binding flagellar brake protein YcgR
MALAVKGKVTSQERRRYKRVLIKMAIRYKSIKKGEVSKTIKSHSDDFSAGGLAMHTNQKMRRGQMLMLNLFIPVSGKMSKNDEVQDYTKSSCQTAGILARVAHCTKVKENYSLGIQFLDLEKNHRKFLKTFLVKTKLLKPGVRLYSS